MDWQSRRNRVQRFLNFTLVNTGWLYMYIFKNSVKCSHTYTAWTDQVRAMSIFITLSFFFCLEPSSASLRLLHIYNRLLWTIIVPLSCDTLGLNSFSLLCFECPLCNFSLPIPITTPFPTSCNQHTTFRSIFFFLASTFETKHETFEKHPQIIQLRNR